MMDIEQIFRDAVMKEASDIFIVAGQPVTYSIHGRMVTVEDEQYSRTV
jgi:Tfp pilus assembly pilus retraction ATPase PilT